MPEQNPAPVKRKRTAKKAVAVSPEQRLAELREKYRVDDVVKIVAVGSNGRPLGRGPLLDPQVFTKFAELDTSPDKRYLDWMLYQAGGGAVAEKKSIETWGDNTEPRTPEDIIAEFSRLNYSERVVDHTRSAMLSKRVDFRS